MTVTQPAPPEPGSGTTAARLTRMFAPQAVAVVGASESAEKAGRVLMDVLASFPGPVYPVNRTAGEIAGRRAYPTIRDIPVPVDLAMIAVPPADVPGVVGDCARAGVGGAVVCTGGFAEAGGSGAVYQEEIAVLARQSGLRLLGPNTSGFLIPARPLLATFMPGVNGIRPGSLAIVAQSGGVNLAAAFMAAQRGYGVSLAVGLGNAVDVGFCEMLDHLAEDGTTTAIALHVEGVTDGRALMAAIRRVTARKPVIAYKVGESDVSDFARSHTGALAGGWAVARAGLEQAGAVVVDSLTDLVDAAGTLSVMRFPPAGQGGVGVVTGQAGPGLIITDALSTAGIQVPALSQSTRARLSRLLPPLTYQRNPVDTGRPGPAFFDVMTAVGDDEAIDALLVYALQERSLSHLVAALQDPVRRRLLPPLLMATGGPEHLVAEQRQALRAAGVATVDAPDRAAFVMGALIADARARTRPAHPGDVMAGVAAAERIAGEGLIDEHAGKGLLDAIGIRTPRRRLCRTVEDAARALEGLSRPVVVKILDASVTHKTAAGGVRVGIRTETELHEALTATAAAAGSQPCWLLEEQAPPGTELIIGGTRDTSFGPAVIIGPGGTSVEWGSPPLVRVAPVSKEEARRTVEALPRALASTLGPDRQDEMAGVLSRISVFMARHPEILELDSNPLRATSTGLIALDAVFRLAARDPQRPGLPPLDEKDAS
jgi:acetate---CoA ligase (ADP-forming)